MNICGVVLLKICLVGNIAICNIPLHNNYYKTVLPEKVVGHRDAKCQTFADKNFAKRLIKSFRALEPYDTAKIERLKEDFRVYIRFNYGKVSKEIYISSGGYVLDGIQLYKPRKDFLKLIEEKINDSWAMPLQ